MHYLNKALLEATDMTELQVMRLSEDAKTQSADKLVSNLYKILQKKSKSVNFEEIDDSMGDVDKLKCYKSLQDGMNFLNKLAEKSKNADVNDLLKVLDSANAMLVKNKKYFKEGYKINNTLLKNTYVSTVAIMIQLVSYVISSDIKFINNGIMFETKLTNYSPKLKKHLGYNKLKELVKLDETNKLEPVFKKCLTLTESVSAIVFLGLTLTVLTSIRGIIYLFLTTKIKLAEYLDNIATYVELNQANIRDPKIKEKQQKWVNRLEKLRDKIIVDQEVASYRATEDINQDDAAEFNINNAEDSTDLGVF